jgi:hypothetical protein
MEKVRSGNSRLRENFAYGINRHFQREGLTQKKCSVEGRINEVLVISNKKFRSNDDIINYVSYLNRGVIKQYFDVYGFEKVLFRSESIERSYNEFELENSIF